MKRIYLAWWDNGESYSDWSADAEIVTSDLNPTELRKHLLAEAKRQAIEADNEREKARRKGKGLPYDMIISKYPYSRYASSNEGEEYFYGDWDVVLTEYIWKDDNLVPAIEKEISNADLH